VKLGKAEFYSASLQKCLNSIISLLEKDNQCRCVILLLIFSLCTATPSPIFFKGRGRLYTEANNIAWLTY